MNTKTLLAVNWKMNLTIEEAKKIAFFLKEANIDYSKVDLLLFPSFLHITPIIEILKDTPIRIGGQNVCYEAKGSYTGETSAFMLKNAGCHAVLLGHSERRYFFDEDYTQVQQKIQIALKENLEIVLCVGETTEENQTNISEMAIVDQLVSALDGLNKNCLNNITIAYEPIWAIGTGKTAPIVHSSHIHEVIRETINNIFNKDCAQNLRVVYGGSVKADNIDSLLQAQQIDGVLVGGACTNKNSFLQVLKNLKYI